MKFSACAMLAVSATSFLSMVSAQTIAELLAAECAVPTPSPTKAKGASKGAKGDSRRQLQAKSNGKGSKSDDSSITCTGKWLAAEIGTSLNFRVFDACDLDPAPNMALPPADAIGTIEGDGDGPFFDGLLTLDAGEFLPYPFGVTFEGFATPDSAEYLAMLKDKCEDLDLPETFSLFGGNNLAPVVIIEGESEPNEDSLLVPFGVVTVGTTTRTTYVVFYLYTCIGFVDYAGLPQAVSDYYAAYINEGEICSFDELESGKKGDGR